MIDPFSESEIEGVAGRYVAKGQHLKGFQDGKGNVSKRMDGGGIDGSGDRTSPLQGKGGGDFLLGGKAKLLDPLADFSVAGAALCFEGSPDFNVSKFSPSDHKQSQG